MIATPRVLLAGLIAATVLAPAPGRSAEPPDKAVISAAVSFSIGYGVWLWEKTCRSMPAASKAVYDAVVADDLKRLSAAADLKLFNASVHAAQKLPTGSETPVCGTKEAEGFADFGLKMAQDAATALATLPPGYHLTISD